MALHSDIRAALETQLANTAGLPTARNWEAVTFDPPAVSVPYVRASYQPTSSRAVTMGNAPVFLHLGLFLVDLFYPLGQGPKAAEAMADAVRARFKIPLMLVQNGTRVAIRYCERGAGLPADGRFLVPVTVAWRVHSTEA
jgi:hypothetical protein